MANTLKLNKIFEDDYILVIDKPSGLVVNRSATTDGVTLQDVIEEDYDIEVENEEFMSRSGIVHRLDKDTSGVLVVAKDEDVFTDLLSQFKARSVKKEYLAVVHGVIEESQLEINAPIKRNPKHPLKFAVVSAGRESVTYVEVLKTLSIDGNAYTLVRVFPKTGRTHQIRVHLAALNHFVAGDLIYCPGSLFDIDQQNFGRLMLHARELSFRHPESRKEVTFSSNPPKEFVRFLK